MRVSNEVGSKVEGNVLFPGKEFTVEASAHVFAIMSKNIYANPIRAIVRELICNGLDAHTRAHQANPVEIYLPTEDDPTFKVVDFGVGMTQTDVDDVYSVLFKSSKQGSNREIGMLGLGAKAPFAYTSQFTMKTSRNKKGGHYLIFKNENGIPQINVVSETTGLPNGTEVEVPVKPADFSEFYKAVIQTIPFLRTMPVVKRGVEELKGALIRIDWKTRDGEVIPILNDMHERIYSGKMLAFNSSDSDVARAAVVSTVSSFTSSCLGIIMGGVVYEVEAAHIDKEQVNKYSYPCDSIHSSMKLIHVDVGDVDIQPSREALNYSEKTIDVLKKIFYHDFQTDVKLLKNCSITTIESIRKIRNFTKLADIVWNKWDEYKDSAENVSKLGTEIALKHSFIAKTSRNDDKMTYTGITKYASDVRSLYSTPSKSVSALMNAFTVGKLVIETLIDPKVSQAIILDEKTLESCSKKLLMGGYCPTATQTLVNKIDIVASGKDVILIDEKIRDTIAALKTDVEFFHMDDLKVQRERAIRSGEINRSIHEDAEPFISRDGVQYSYSKLKDMIAKGETQKIVYELYTGVGPHESDRKPMWQETVDLTMMDSGVKKADVVKIVNSNRGFVSQASNYESLIGVTYMKAIGASPHLEKATDIVVALRWKDFVGYEIWKDSDFVQVNDYYRDFYVSKIDLAAGAVSQLIPEITGWMSLQRAQDLDNEAKKMGIDLTGTVMGDAINEVMSNKSTLTSYEIKTRKNAAIHFINEVTTMFQISVDQFKAAHAKINDTTFAENASKEDDARNARIMSTYPMLAICNNTGRFSTIIDYVVLVGK